MKKTYLLWLLSAWLLCQHVATFAQSTISVAPPSCYPGGLTAAQMDTRAAASGGAYPFATWKGAYDYAHTGSGAATVTTINFAPGTYITSVTGVRADWGDADGGFVLKAGLTVNGNGALISNEGAGSSALCFATLGTNSTITNFIFKNFSGNPSGGALYVPTSASNWTVNNCTFDNCNWGTDAMTINMGTTAIGTISGCTFINNGNPLGYYPPVSGVGAGSSSALNITGSLTSDLNITNSVFKCNFRNTSGGAVAIHDDVHVDFTGCVFGGNEANSSNGGAVSIKNNAVVSFTNTNFTCNFTSGGTIYDGGALKIESGSTVTIDGCNFKGNGSPDATWTASADTRSGGAIAATGASASIVNLTITNTIFDANLAGNGAGIFMNDVNANLNSNYFISNNATTEGGGIFVAKGNNTSTYTMSNNTFTSNDASGACTGIDVFTEMPINGTNNDLQYLADGSHLSNQPGSLQFNNGGTGDYANATAGWVIGGTVTSNGDRLLLGNNNYSYASRQVSSPSTTNTVSWTFTMYTANTFTANTKYIAYVLTGSSSDFTQGNGLAIVKGRTGDAKIELVSYNVSAGDTNGGMDNNTNMTPITTINTPANEDGYTTFKIVYNQSTALWSIYYSLGTGDVPTNETDPRGFRWCSTSAPSTLTTLTSLQSIPSSFYIGPAFKTTSSTQGLYGSIFFRSGDETSGTGWTGAYTAATCTTCQSTSAVANSCIAQGSITGTLYADTNQNGVQDAGEAGLSGVQVRLYDDNGTLIATTTTNSTGDYYFGGLPAGTYRVNFSGTPPGNPYPTTANVNNNGVPADDSDNVGGYSQLVTITTDAAAATNAAATNSTDGTSGAAHYSNIDAGFSVSPLAVNLTSFVAKNNDCKSNTIKWVTAQENNHSHFVLERSYTGDYYEEIATIYAQGNATAPQHYVYEDKDVKATNFYRLKAVSLDGVASYSSIIGANSTCGNNAVTVFPNPISSYVAGTLSLQQADDVRFELYTVTGQLVATQVLAAPQGISSFNFDAATLQAGTYVLKAIGLSNNEILAISKVIK